MSETYRVNIKKSFVGGEFSDLIVEDVIHFPSAPAANAFVNLETKPTVKRGHYQGQVVNYVVLEATMTPPGYPEELDADYRGPTIEEEPLWFAELDTSHFSFQAFGRSEDHVRAVMAEAWARHCKEYEVANNWDEFEDGVRVIEFSIGEGYRDMDTIGGRG